MLGVAIKKFSWLSKFTCSKMYVCERKMLDSQLLCVCNFLTLISCTITAGTSSVEEKCMLCFKS
uniref:Uncharacterized protein n=1 Tax=Arundo donax TaxID=35708 RepID=A0A0A9GUT5_ARUDO